MYVFQLFIGNISGQILFWLDQEKQNIFTIGLSDEISFKNSHIRTLPIPKTPHSIRYQKEICRMSHLAGQFQFNTGFDLSYIQYLKVLSWLAVLHLCLDTYNINFLLLPISWKPGRHISILSFFVKYRINNAALVKSSPKICDKMGHIRPQFCAPYAKKHTGLKKAHYHR